MRLALYQPDIPQNAGTLLRLAACLDLPVDVIEPCGFVFDDRRMRRAGMDYLDRVDLSRHRSWQAFLESRAAGFETRPEIKPGIKSGITSETQAEIKPGRLVLLTTAGDVCYADFAFMADDVLLVGRESAGVPDEVHDAVRARLRIPMVPGVRALNVAAAAAMVLGEALRQTGGFPTEGGKPG